MAFVCKTCNKSFTRKDTLPRHLRQFCRMNRKKQRLMDSKNVKRQKTGQTSKYCFDCKKMFPKMFFTSHLRSNEHKNIVFIVSNGIEKIKAFKERIISYRIKPEKVHINVKQFFEDVFQKLSNLLALEVKNITV